MKKHTRKLLVLIFILGFVPAAFAVPGYWAESKLLEDGGGIYFNFGKTVSVSGNRMAVGAGPAGTDRAYVYEYDGNDWVKTAKLRGDTEEGLAWFGDPVSIDGDRVVVGTTYTDDFGEGSGSVNLFQKRDVVDPLPDVKINGFDGPLGLTKTGQDLIISGFLLAGETVGKVDWWLFADTPRGRYSYINSTQQWVPGIQSAAQARVQDKLEQVLINTADLPLGTTVIQGGADLTPNGVLDEPMYLDSVELTITNR